MNLSTDRRESATKLWQFVREKAALSGAFDPLALMKADPAFGQVDEDAFVDALTRLGYESDEVHSDTGPRWRLNSDSRRSVLRQLYDDRRLTEVALSVKGFENDLFGRCLVDSVLGYDVLARSSGREELDELHTVAQFLAGLTAEFPLPINVERALARKEADAAIAFLLPHKFVGRQNALRALHFFTITPEVDAEPALALVTGPGGAGKSALLAEFVRRRRMTDANTAVVWIDFDRAGMVSADPVALMVEFAFQLSLTEGPFAPSLIEFREKVRHFVGEASSFEERASIQSAMWSDWLSFMGPFLPLKDPIVLILDTFEEVLCRDQLVSASLLRWIDNLVAEGRVFGLKPILSGRTIPEQAIAPMLDRIDLRLPLDDIEPDHAHRLLAMHLERDGCNPGAFPIEALVSKLGGNPLLLKILAQDLRDHGVSEAKTILAEVENSKFHAQFAQTFLYRRILGRLRIDDPDIVKVAHPGLVLRRVTPGLIQDVLAGPCALGKISDSRAKELFDKLALQVWLIERIGENTVRHRRDLRRLMLQSMASEHPEVTNEIHRSAVEYYRHYRDPSIGEREQDTERRYHSLFTSDPEMPRDSEADAFVTAIGGDIFDIDIGLRAELKVRGSRSLSEDEELAVPQQVRQQQSAQAWSSRKAHGSLEEGDAEESEAAGFISLGQIERTLGGFFNASRFELIANSADLMSHQFFIDHAKGKLWVADSKVTMLDHPMWWISMAVLPTPGRRRFIKNFAKNAMAHARLIKWNQSLTTRSDAISMALMTACILALHGEKVPDFLSESMIGLDVGKRRQDHDLLRQLSLAGLKGWSGRMHVPLKVLRFMSPQFRDAIAVVAPDEVLISDELRYNPSVHLVGDIDEANPAFLGRIESVGSDWGDVIEVVRWPPRSEAVACILRPTMAELHAPARGCLKRAGFAAVLEYAERMERLDLRWPLELHANRLQGGLQRDADRWHATFVRTCDRFGRFDDLLEFLARRAPESRTSALLAVLQAYERRLGAAGLPNRNVSDT